MTDDTPNYWGTTSAQVLDAMREMEDLIPALEVLMVAPVGRGTLYVEKKPGALLKMKERVRVAFIHKDDVQTIQTAMADAGRPPLRIVTAADMAPWEPPPLKPFVMDASPSGYRVPWTYIHPRLED